MNFEVSSPGKWIMAGEHAVLRGKPAVVFPLKAKRLSLSFEKKSGGHSCEVSGSYDEGIKDLFWQVLKQACAIADSDLKDFEGHFVLSGDLPLGSGLGASASLCVALGRLFHQQDKVSEDRLYGFCRELENFFHGESSGLDIAVTLHGQGLKFIRGGERRFLKPLWTPHCYLSYSGRRGMTAECVSKVKNFMAQNPKRGEELDDQMAQASEKCLKSLEETQSFELLKEGLELAAACFTEWGLVGSGDHQMIQELKASGAVVVKPTGSGGGGYLLGLWREKPSDELINKLKLVPCF